MREEEKGEKKNKYKPPHIPEKTKQSGQGREKYLLWLRDEDLLCEEGKRENKHHQNNKNIVQ